MSSYDGEQFDPPAPVAYITVRTLDAGDAVHGICCLLDTGADVTILPASVVHRLAIQPVPDRLQELSGYGNTRAWAQLFQAEIIVSGRSFRGDYLAPDQPYGILGRNLLNQLPLVFDGPRLRWGIAASVSEG